MSTLQTDVRCRRSDRGVTVVELLVAVVIMGLLAVLVSVPLQMTNRLSKNALDRASEILDSNLALRSMARQLQTSQVTRSGIITCTGQSEFVTTKKDRSLRIEIPKDGTELPEDKRRFTIPYSAGSSIGAISPTDSKQIHLADPTAFLEGDLVVVVSSERTDRIGVYTVDKISEVDGKPTLTLGPPQLTDLKSDCSIDSSKLTDIANFGADVDGAKSAASVFVSSLRFAKYEVQMTRLVMQNFPRASDYNYVAFENLKMLNIQARWYDVDDKGKSSIYKDESGNDLIETNGSYLARLDVDLVETGMAAANDDRGNPTQMKIERRYSTYARYVMTATKKMNDKAITNAKPAKEKNPTCFLAASAHLFTPDIEQSELPFREYVVVLKGGVSDGVVSGINVETHGSPEGEADCIYFLNAKAGPKAKGKLSGSSILIARNNDPDDYAICSVSGSVRFTGRGTHYDANIDRNMPFDCSENVGSENGKNPKQPPLYEFKAGDEPKCNLPASCLPGRLTKVGGTNNVYPIVESCKWSDGANHPCCEIPKSGTASMTSVSYRVPKDIQVQGNVKLGVSCN